ncbi:MAG TPA: TIM barrel protein [Tepidisphaeraceae bacterium]|nr:TIM barrel protein [Tepidisphaeraceae bacterium]
MRVGMNLFLWTTNVTEELFPLFPQLKSLGYEGVEVPIARANKPIYQEIRKVLDDCGLACTTMFNLSEDKNPISSDPKIRQKGLDELKWAIDISQDEMRSEALVGPYFSAYAVFSGKGPTPQELQWSAKVMKEAAQHAGDLRMSIEFLNRFEIYLLNTTAETSAFVDLVGCSNFGILYDTHQAHHEENNISQAIISAGNRINHVHFSENQRGTLGTGMVDWIGTVKALKRINYDKWIMVESFAKDVPPLSEKAHVWRNCFGSKEEVYEKGYSFVRDLWNSITVDLPDPIITVRQAGDVRIHTFISSFEDNNIANATHIIESQNSLVLVDGQFLVPYARKFREYADSLQKPIDRLYLSHRHPDHWFGLGTAFGDIDIYALHETKSFIEEHGEDSRKDHLAKMGNLAPDKIVVPQNLVRPGVETIDGVKYVFSRVTDTEIDFLLTIGLPEIGVYIAQDLIYSGTHLYLTKDMEHWIQILEQLSQSNYELFMPGHGFPADKNEVAENIKYLSAAKQALRNGLTNAAFKEFMLQRFPKRECPGIFDIYLPRLFDGASQF